MEAQAPATPVLLAYLDSMIGMFRARLFVDLTHHVMHALGSRVWASPRGS